MTSMVHRLRRSLLLLTCACLLAGLTVPVTAGARLLAGISDNSTAMFSSHLFNRINLTVARYIVPWDAAVTRNKTQLQSVQAWAQTARADGVQPMVSFTGETGTTSSYVPSSSQYAAAMSAFIRAVPQVKTYTAWNEPDWIYRPRLANNPALAASYFNALIRICHRCTIVAGDLYLPNPQLGRWIRSYRRYLAARPKAWALHNYYDVRSHTTGQLRTLMSLTSGQVWLTEISGVERRGHWQFRNQSPSAAARDEAFLFALPRRFHRVTRIYHYQWQDTGSAWDSSLLGRRGKPLPAYWTVANAVGRRR